MQNGSSSKHEVEYIVVLITAPTEEFAAEIGLDLVEHRLAACATVIPQVRSIYRWDGGIHDEREAQLIVKTSAAKYDKIQARVRKMHPYQVPEILALPIHDGSSTYLRWIDGATYKGMLLQEPGAPKGRRQHS